MHVIAAKAVAFKEAATPEFRNYQEQVISVLHQLCFAGTQSLFASAYRHDRILRWRTEACCSAA